MQPVRSSTRVSVRFFHKRKKTALDYAKPMTHCNLLVVNDSLLFLPGQENLYY